MWILYFNFLSSFFLDKSDTLHCLFNCIQAAMHWINRFPFEIIYKVLEFYFGTYVVTASKAKMNRQPLDLAT